MDLSPPSRRPAGPAGGAPARPAPDPAPSPDRYARLEGEVTRTADLVLKVHRLLERAEGLEAQPDRSARIARLAWVVEHGQAALRRAAQGADGVPQPAQP